MKPLTKVSKVIVNIGNEMSDYCVDFVNDVALLVSGEVLEGQRVADINTTVTEIVQEGINLLTDWVVLQFPDMLDIWALVEFVLLVTCGWLQLGSAGADQHC